jgi:tetratricopeptide (TPR) repeat protein
MLKKMALSSLLVIAAVFVLAASLLRCASVNYAFSGQPNVDAAADLKKVDYNLPYPGKILPDSPLWPIKALRDRLWLWLTFNETKKAELMLLYADKRLASSQTLFQKGKAEIAFSTLTKAEKYLELASLQVGECWNKGLDTKSLSYKVALAALKHQEVIQEILTIAPEDARAGVIKTMDIPQNIFTRCRDSLVSRGLKPPENPFNVQ